MIAFITGATRGIGKEIALELSKRGFDIAVNYRKETSELEEVKKEIEENGVKSFFVQGDVSSFEDCEKMVENVEKEFGKIDVLVNNAGITKDGLIMRMKKEDFESVIDVNLTGTFNVTRNVIPYMIKQKSGRIINISSVVGVAGNAGQTNYSASKAGIIGNAIAPGFINTDMTKVLPDNVKENINSQIPLKRMGTAKEVAKVVAFLAGEDSTYITGQVINVDGGMI